MKRRVTSILLLTVIVVGGWIIWYSFAERRNANRIVEAIEDYRETHGRLPDPKDHGVMKQLGFELRAGWHPDYKIEENGLYRITILEGFDGPYRTYNSLTKTWRKD